MNQAVVAARAVLFDFDFTLADSSEGIVVCMNHALARLGLPPASTDAIRRTIGLDLNTAFGILAGEEWRSREEEFLEHFIRKADQVMVASTVFLPGAAGAPDTSRSRVSRRGGHHQVPAPCRGRPRAGRAPAFVEVIVGADDVPRPKPAPDGLLRAVGSLGIPAGDCVFVGDSEVDARAAQAAGMAFVAVLSGTTAEGVFARYPARAVLVGVGEVVPEK